MNENKPKAIDEALNSLDGLQRAEAGPFLFSKITARLQTADHFIPPHFAWRMVAVLAMVALLNVLTLRRAATEQHTDGGAQSVATEYSIALPQTY